MVARQTGFTLADHHLLPGRLARLGASIWPGRCPAMSTFAGAQTGKEERSAHRLQGCTGHPVGTQILHVVDGQKVCQS
jgi:hypothetical protein